MELLQNGHTGCPQRTLLIGIRQRASLSFSVSFNLKFFRSSTNSYQKGCPQLFLGLTCMYRQTSLYSLCLVVLFEVLGKDQQTSFIVPSECARGGHLRA